MWVNVLVSMYKYWIHIVNAPTDSLVKHASTANMSLHNEGAVSYYTRLENMLSNINCQQLLTNIPDEKSHSKHVNQVNEMVKAKYTEIIEQKLIISEQNTDKVKYENFKIGYSRQVYKPKKYLLSIKCMNTRKAITKARLFSHPLPSCVAHYRAKNDSDKICKQCNKGSFGNLQHMMFECNNEVIQKKRENFLVK